MRWLLCELGSVLRTGVGLAVAYATLAFAVSGSFRDPGRTATAPLWVLSGLAAILLARLFQRLLSGGRERPRRRWADYELGTLFVAAAFVSVEVTGGPTGLLYPLVYALAAFLVAFHGAGASLYFLGLILATEAAIWWQQPSDEGWRVFGCHACFNLLFGLLYALFLRSEFAQRRRAMRQQVEAHLQAVARDAREFRLTSALSLDSRELSAEEIKQRRRTSSVQAIRESLYNILAVGEKALLPHTAAIWWLDPDDKQLRLKELSSQSDFVTERPIPAAAGVFGAITKRRRSLVLTNLPPGHAALVYYSGDVSVTDFAGVPIMEGEHLRGVLVADRTHSRPFDDSDVAVLQALSSEIVRAVQVEHLFTDMDREKYQKERFYQASRAFNAALTTDQVAQVTIDAALRVARVEFAGVAVATEDERRLRVAAAFWHGHEEVSAWVGEEFAAAESLVGKALKARHPLPHGTSHSVARPVLGKAMPLDLPGVKVMPLLWKDQGMGALVLGSTRESSISFDVTEMLRVIADHAAIAIANAQMYEHLEEMARTDGLTGLANHRCFQEMFDDILARSARYNRSLALMLMDIDHFKVVNDTFGHPVGDQVLKRIAGILRATARRSDVVARYGGEEFAVLMAETDRHGALRIAERIRKAVAAQRFPSDHGAFSCTVSLGVAAFPEDAREKADLTACADGALYRAKRAGRDQTAVHRTRPQQREAS